MFRLARLRQFWELCGDPVALRALELNSHVVRMVAIENLPHSHDDIALPSPLQ